MTYKWWRLRWLWGSADCLYGYKAYSILRARLQVPQWVLRGCRPHIVLLHLASAGQALIQSEPDYPGASGVQVTMTVVSVSLINWRLVGASNSRKRWNTSRNGCTSELSYWNPKAWLNFLRFFLLKVETKVKTLEILSHEKKSLSATENFTRISLVSHEKLLMCLADFDPVEVYDFQHDFPITLRNYTNMAEMVFKNKSQDLWSYIVLFCSEPNKVKKREINPLKWG